MTVKNHLRFLIAVALCAFIGGALPIAAQSPNTAAMVVVVVDQNGAVVPDAQIKVLNNATGATRDVVSNGDGSATVPALSLTGTYTVTVSKAGFGNEEIKDVALRSSETATIRVTLQPGSQSAEVLIYGTAEGVRTDPQIGRSLDTETIDETPILGRKTTTLPLLNSAFRQAKGTGDLFVNQTYFVTGVGGRRQTTVLVDGGNNDEGWGRQTAVATIPLGAIQEINILSNSFSSEFGWTSGPALNIVTKSGTNKFHGEGLFLARPGAWQAKRFSTKFYCPPSVSTCVVPTTLQSIDPVDIPDALAQVSGSFGGPIIKDKTFFFASSDYTRQDRTTYLSTLLPAFVLPSNGQLDYTGHYRQFLFDGRVDHRLTSNQSLMGRFNVDRFSDDNPQDAVGGTNAPSVARRYSRRSWTAQLNHTWVVNSNLLNEARFAYLNGDPVTLWEPQTLSTTFTRAGASPFTIGESRASDIYSRQAQFSDTASLTYGRHYLRIGGSITRHNSGGTGNEPGQATLGTVTFKSTTTAPFDQLTINDVQSYSQPIDFGISSYKLGQWLVSGFVQDDWKVRPNFTLNLGLRYDRQTLTQATKNFAPRVGFAWNPGSDARTSIRGGYGMYYTQIRSNLVAGYLLNGLDGIATYTATAGQTGFPTCLSASCLPVPVNPRGVLSLIPARNITIRAGQRAFYQEQFARYGLNFNLLPNYPEKLVNPRSQVFTIGAEREFFKGMFFAADFVKQHLSGIDRTVDINAPTPYYRNAPGQVRSVAAANATRPILPVNGGVRQVNVLTNLGVADYHALQTQFTYRGNSRLYASVGYTLSKATNTSEPDGNGIGPNESIITELGEQERGPSVLDQRHRAVIFVSYRLPLRFTVGTLSQFASARPFNATTGIDNNGDGVNNDRPVINGGVIRKSAFRGTGTQDVSIFVENRIKTSETTSLVLRLEGFNIFNHANILGRAQTLYPTLTTVGGVQVDTATPRSDFGALSTAFTNAARTNATPAFANIDPPRMFQLQARFVF
jgi:hypothetical protein